MAVKQNKSGLQVLFYDIIDLLDQYSLFSPEEVKDEHYIEQLKIWRSVYRLKYKEIQVVIPSNDAVLHSFQIDSSLADWEIAEAIQSEIENVATKEVNGLRIACHNSDPDSEDKFISMLACGIPNVAVQRYVNILEQADLKPARLTVDALEIFNAFKYFHNQDLNKPITILYGRNTQTICLILTQNKYPFVRGFNLEAGDQNEAGETAEFANKGDSIAFHELTDLDFLTSLRSKSDLACSAAPTFLERLLTEVRKYQRHVQSCEGFVEMGTVYLTGDLVTEPQIIDMLKQELKTDVKIWNPFDVLFDDADAKKTGYRFIAALGATIREMDAC